jgi:hypothetical protein
MQSRGKVALAIVMAGAMSFGGVAVSCGGGDDSSAPDDDASTVVHHDAGGPVDDDATTAACTPELPAGYTSTWSPPLSTDTACTTDQVQAFYTQCFDPAATSTGCQTFANDNANKACVGCMYTTQGSSSYGAIISLSNGTAEANIGGCLALVDGDMSATSCGAKYQAGQFCEIDACDCTIDNTDPKTFTAFTTCESNAGKTVCAGYESDAGCEKDAKYAVCNKATTFEQYMIAIGDLICASGNVSDAGPDSGDASIDDASDDASDASDDASDAADD